MMQIERDYKVNIHGVEQTNYLINFFFLISKLSDKKLELKKRENLNLSPMIALASQV
jgi:hypothetical protein